MVRQPVETTRQTGQVRPSTHMDGYRVHQDLSLDLVVQLDVVI
jgi:hypothetical protein